MGNRKSYGARRWAWVAGLTFVLFAWAPFAESDAVEIGSGESVLVFVAHPDDDILLAGGLIASLNDAGAVVTVAYMTNGDRCDSPSQQVPGNYCFENGILPEDNHGTVRQDEAVAAQALLGTVESDLIFLGYPNGFLSDIRYQNGPTEVLVHTETYAHRGLGGTDWHDYRSGPGEQHGQYNRTDMLADATALVDTYRPDHIFTHSPWDRHSDHIATYYALVEAVSNISGYDPIIHTGIVHVQDDDDCPGGHPPCDWGHWPATEAPSVPTNEYFDLGSDTDGELVWEHRESFIVPSYMQGSNPPNNVKEQAVEAHATQVGADAGFIRRFIHLDEIFWPERLGAALGMPDTFAVDEGASLGSSFPGVLSNDVRGIDAAAAPFDPDPVGPMEAELVPGFGPSHATSFSFNTDGTFSYTHDGSETTNDSFRYRPVQDSVDGDYTTVTININPVNDGPTATGDSYAVNNGASLSVPADGVLDNDTDPEDDTLTASKVSDPSHGSLSLNSDGSFTYTHDGSATTSDSFTYRANDGQYNSNTVTVSLTINDDVPDPLAVGVSGPDTGATDVTYTFSADATGGDGTKSYVWQAKEDGAVVASGASSKFSFSSSSAGSFLIEVTVTDSTGSASGGQDFTVMGDIAESPFVSDIIWLADEGITQGCNPPANDQFCPNDRVTRGQMAAFLVRFLGLTAIDPKISFSDTSGSVFETNILKLATAGITRGCNAEGTLFCPNEFVTRGQMAAFLVRAFGLTDDGGGDLFTDDDGSIFEANIDKLATAGITRGCNPPVNDLFCPNDVVTRGQMAAFLHRADGLSG